jgi:hypothetical protein
MVREAGKGSRPRPFSVSADNFNSNWNRTFRSPVRLENPLNQEIWWCNDLSDIRSVDGVDYVTVYKKETPNRTHLMRKTALNKVT